MKKLIVMLGVLLLAAVMVRAVENLSDNGTAKAKIIQAATLAHQSGALDFGVIIADTTGGTSTIAAQSGVTSASDSTGLKRATGAVSSDHFTLSNLDTATTYNVAVDPSVEIVNASDATKKMTVALTVSDDEVTGVASKELYVGGTLTIGASQAAGNYEGQYAMTVTY